MERMGEGRGWQAVEKVKPAVGGLHLIDETVVVYRSTCSLLVVCPWADSSCRR